MVTKYLQTLNLKFDQVMFNSLVLTWERNFEVMLGIFSALVFQRSVLESYLDTFYKISCNKTCENCDNLWPLNQSFTNILSLPKKYSTDLSHFT